MQRRQWRSRYLLFNLYYICKNRSIGRAKQKITNRDEAITARETRQKLTSPRTKINIGQYLHGYLLEKTEEQAIYTIQLNEKLEQQNTDLNRKIQHLEAEISQIKQSRQSQAHASNF